VGAQAEQKSEQVPRDEQVSWIVRERAPITQVTEGFQPSGPEEPGTLPATPSAPDATSPWEPLQRVWASRPRLIVFGAGGILALVAILVAVHYGNRSAAPTEAAGSIPLVSARAPGLTAVTSSVEFSGAIYARYDMAIGTEGETGRIAAVYVEAGDHVRKGQLLARLDGSVLRPQVDRLAATLEEARANAALADAEYTRAHAVESAGALSAEEIEKRRAAAATASAQVKVAAAQLAEYQARLDHTEIRAPEDGTVLTRTAEVGQIATPGGTALFRLARGGEMEMRGQVAEQDLPAVKVGQPALVHLTGIERPFSGKVRLLGAVIDTQTRLGEIRVALNPDPDLRPGAFARGEVIVGRAARPVLPQTAVLSDEHGTYVYVVNDSSQVERRRVRVSDTTADGIVIGSGLTGKERVVITAAAFLREGERVNVASPSSGP